MLATVQWIAPTGGNWNTAANWQDQTTLANRLPTAGDDVVIPDIGTIGAADQTITFGGGAATIQSLTSAEKFTLNDGALLTLSGGTQTMSIAGAALLSKAGLKSATLASGTMFTVDGGTILFGGNSVDYIGTLTQGAITFTFLPSLTIRGKSGRFAGQGSGGSNPTYQVQGPFIVDAGGAGQLAGLHHDQRQRQPVVVRRLEY